VELSRIGDNVRLGHYNCEEVKSGVEDALQNLIERQQPGNRYVAVNIDSSMVISKLISMPYFDDDHEVMQGWIYKQCTSLLENEPDSDSYIIRSSIQIVDEEHSKLYISAIKKEQVENIRDLLNEFELTPSIITDGIIDVAYPLILSDDFINGKSNILRVFEDRSILCKYNNGVLQSLTPLQIRNSTASELFDELNLIFSSESGSLSPNNPAPVYLMISQELTGFEILRDRSFGEQSNIRLLPAEEFFELGKTEISDDYSIALALAFKQLYPELDEINFLDPEIPDSLSEEIEKKDTIIFAGLAVFLLLILLIGTYMFYFYADYKFEQTRSTAGQIEDRIIAIEQEMSELTRERERINQVRNLIRSRSLIAPGLHKIGELTPRNVWLFDIDVSNNTPSKSYRIRGYSLSDTGFSRFMENLENAGFENLVLRNIERIQSDQVFSVDEYRPRSLIRFEVQMLTINNLQTP